MVGGNESFSHPAALSTTSSFTDDPDADLSHDGAKRHDVAEADEHALLRRSAANLAEERPGGNASVPSSSQISLPPLSTVDEDSTASPNLSTNSGLFDVPDTGMFSQGQDGVGLNGVFLAPQQPMESDQGPLSPDRGFASGTGQPSDSVNQVANAADRENDVTDNDAIVFHAMTSDTIPEPSTALPPPIADANHVSNDSTAPEMPGTITSAYDDPYHDTYNDDDYDDDHGGHYDYLHNGSLIELSDLFGFTHDRLPLTVPGNAGGDDDDFSAASNNTEKFYVSDDDEFSVGDPIDEDFLGADTADDMDMDLADTNQYVGSPNTGNEPTIPDHPLPSENLPSPRDDERGLEDDDIDDDDDDVHDHGPNPMSRDSTDTDFLKSTQFHSFSPTSPFTHDLQLVLESRDNARHDMTVPIDTPELAARFLRSLPPGLSQPRIQNILGDFSLSRDFISNAPGNHGILVQKLEYASVAASRAMSSSDMDLNPLTVTFPHPKLLFDIRSSSPVTTAMESIPAHPAFSGEHFDRAVSNVTAGPLSPEGKDANGSSLNRPLLSEEQYEEIHRSSEHSSYFVEPSLILKAFDAPVASSLLATPLAPSEDEMYTEANGITFPALERNLTFSQFVRQWFVRSRVPHAQLGMEEPFVSVSSEAANVLDWHRPPKVSRPNGNRAAHFDIQGIPWHRKLKVQREDARVLRDQLYRSYHNLKYRPHGYASTLPQTEGYFQAKTMYTKHKAAMEHFQLRNVMSVTASNTLQYAYRSRIYSITPFYDERNCIMDFSNPGSSSRFLDPVRITAMKAKHGVTVAGGFAGEYALRGEISSHSTVEGFVTRELDGITTHVDIVKHRTSDHPQAVISSNDASIRTLDCGTNKFVHDHKFAQPINCTDTSPDGRLRVIVGDAPDAWVVDAETGKPLQSLSGHRDFGFACAWSPDMLHIATSNQDKTVNIWDARMWRPLQTIDSDVACYRSLHFSPVGGGPRTLLMCEPADRISIVNAQTYQTRQVHDFFGEIGGADFSPDGGRIWVANMDPEFGGFMEFDRRQWGQEFGIGHTRRRRVECRGDMYYPDLPNEWHREADLDNDERCVLGPGERKMRFQRAMDDDRYIMHPFLS